MTSRKAAFFGQLASLNIRRRRWRRNGVSTLCRPFKPFPIPIGRDWPREDLGPGVGVFVARNVTSKRGLVSTWLDLTVRPTPTPLTHAFNRLALTHFPAVARGAGVEAAAAAAKHIALFLSRAAAFRRRRRRVNDVASDGIHSSCSEDVSVKNNNNCSKTFFAFRAKK